LTEAGIEWFDFAENEIAFDQPFREVFLSTLNASATEEATEFEETIRLRWRLKERMRTPAMIAAERANDPIYQASRQAYIEACAVRISGELAGAAQQVRQMRDHAPTLEEAFVLTARKACAEEGAFSHGEQRSEQFCEEIERLRAVAGVTDVRVVSGRVLVYTDYIRFTHPETGRLHKLGKFLLLIDLNGADGGIRWFNGSRRVEGTSPAMNAPNVLSDGKALLDPIKVTMLDQLAACQLADMVDLAIQYLENVDDPRLKADLDNWPLAKNGGKN
jgi:hypothetical protein